jgi:four helix bundle protein
MHRDAWECGDTRVTRSQLARMAKREAVPSGAPAKARRSESKPYERFKAWTACHQLVLAVYRETETWPSSETYGLTAQARRAAFSAALNLAEGSAKRGAREFRRYLDISLGSLSELACILLIARDVGVMGGSAFGEAEVLRDHASRLTWGLYRALRRRLAPTENGAST